MKEHALEVWKTKKLLSSGPAELGVLRGAIAPPIFLKIGGKLAFSTPNISRLVPKGPQRVISISAGPEVSSGQQLPAPLMGLGLQKSPYF